MQAEKSNTERSGLYGKYFRTPLGNTGQIIGTAGNGIYLVRYEGVRCDGGDNPLKLVSSKMMLTNGWEFSEVTK